LELILRDTITADLSPTLDCHIYLLSPNRDFQSVMFKVRYCLEKYHVGRSVTLFECEVDTLVKAVRYALIEPDQNFARDICPRLPGSDKGVCYNCYASSMYHHRKKLRAEMVQDDESGSSSDEFDVRFEEDDTFEN
jgi:hypothetical protein